MKATLICGESRHDLEFESPTLVSTLLAQAGYAQDLPCGGNGRCGKCRIHTSGALAPADAQERALLTHDALEGGIRLSCLAQAVGDVTLVLAESKQMDAVSIGHMPSLSCTPLAKGLGIAVDVGTTTVATYLYDCVAGALLAQATFKNPQQSFGADVISRIEAFLRGESLALRHALVSKLESVAVDMLQRTGHAPDALSHLVLTGNTTMMDILTLTDVSPLSHSPFQIDEFFGRDFPAAELGFAHICAPVYIARTISAFVGSDITCAMLSCALEQAQKPTLLVDIGTNGEMTIAHNGNLFACSTAAGPAFEGAGIAFGSVARAGAMDRVWISNGQICYTTLHDAPATGLCGSGLIDAIAALLDAGLIDDTGAIDEENKAYAQYLCNWQGQPAVRIGDTDILLTQKDVRAVQLAKSAICSGIDALIHHMGLQETDIDKLYIAGGFGAFIRLESAKRIGLIPAALVDCAIAIGNSAGMGALALLLDETRCAHSADFAARTQVLELSTSPYFIDQYVENMMFPYEE